MKKRLKDLKAFAAITAVILVLTAASYIVKSLPKDYGNANEGNLSIFAHQGKWTYLSHLTADSRFQTINGAVYKFTEDEPVPIKFSEEAAGKIKVKGDWIYYVDMKDNRGSIFKMKTDGSEKIKLCDGGSFDFKLYGNYLYYKKYVESYDLIRIKLDGSSNETLGSDVISFYIQGDRIYYISGTQLGNLYKMKLDGSDNERVAEIGGPILYIDDNFIYYNQIDSEATQSKILSQEQYYTGNTGPLYRMRKDGAESEIVIDDDLTNIFVRNNYIYYKPLPTTMTNIENNDFYRTDLNGKNKTKIAIEGYFLGIADKWIYYADIKNSEIYRMTLDFKKVQKIQTDIFKSN